MGAVLTDDAVLTMGFIQLPGKGLLLRQLPLLLGEVDIEVSEPVVERDRAVAGLTMTRDALGRLEGEARLVVRDGMVSEVEFLLTQVVVEEQRGQYRLTDPAFTALEGARAVYGELDGTVYRMEVPDDWNGRLVMWAHGFRDFTPELVADIPPMRDLLIEKGYAWAVIVVQLQRVRAVRGGGRDGGAARPVRRGVRRAGIQHTRWAGPWGARPCCFRWSCTRSVTTAR